MSKTCTNDSKSIRRVLETAFAFILTLLMFSTFQIGHLENPKIHIFLKLFFRHFKSDIHKILKSMILIFFRHFKSDIRKILQSMILNILAIFRISRSLTMSGQYNANARSHVLSSTPPRVLRT